MNTTGTVRKKTPVKRHGKRRTQSSKVRRVREWLWWIWEQQKPCCMFCGEAIPVEDIISGDAKDNVLLHHLKGDRTKNEAKDLGVAHRTCHRSFHRNNEWNGKRWVKSRKERKQS